MKEKVLSRLIHIFAIVGISSYLLAHGSYLDNESKSIANHLFGISFGVVSLSLWLKAISSSFLLEGLCSSSARNLEDFFVFFYPLLTKEARVRWKNKINAKKTFDQDS
ncbi:hypothetical protein [Pseudothauera rhizosphaerae]|uniref:Uncharacterized protein n=1 Tax=Pseudothauera rhizosphaerae TaxID=2565932 RepID=A0A4S4A9V4_9RHOO|nr:hypothetical protein [Pseudothauera rhizosphaerae]THF55361.1 hypothetical protein E6O51_20705 [Pseudothauera rhizosphaerae]